MSVYICIAECCGVCSRRKFVELNKDRCVGCTTAKAIWENAKSSDPLSTHIHDGEITISIHCTCCIVYKDWKRTTPMNLRNYSSILQYADKPFHYTVCPDKQVKMLEQGKLVMHTGTIYSTKCAGIACTNGDHPYMCAHCFELTHGKSSLLKKFNRSKTLKNPRCNDLRATKRGVVHKFCSASQITNA